MQILDVQLIEKLSRKYFPKEMLRKKRIFVVDDNSDILSVLQVILQKHGYVVEISDNSKPLYQLKENLPDLIIVDISLKNEDGRDVYQYLKSNISTSDIPIILYTGKSYEEIKEYPGNFKPECVLTKPFCISDLKGCIERLLLKRDNLRYHDLC